MPTPLDAKNRPTYDDSRSLTVGERKRDTIDSRPLTVEDRKWAAVVLRDIAERVSVIKGRVAARILSSDDGRFLVNVATRLWATDRMLAEDIALVLSWLGDVVRTNEFPFKPENIVRVCHAAADALDPPQAVSQGDRVRRAAADALDPPQAVSQGDKPDNRGYVESPADPMAFVPAADILKTCTPTDVAISMKELGTIVEDYDANRVRWTRPHGKNGRPMRNRRSVHSGDWARYVKGRLPPPDADGFPWQAEDEVEHRKATIRNAKQVGK